MSNLILNPGSQAEFVVNTHRASAYIGGLGSGKTYALNARGLMLSQQPKVGYWGPRGLIAAINYPVLKDVVLPQFLEMVDGTGLMLDYIRSEKKALLVPHNQYGEPDRSLVKKNGEGAAEVLFRSLDRPNWMRGIEIAWFGIDEGRHVGGDSWDILYGRLRQPGYKHCGWVCSTPNGYDWMWEKFHPDSQKRLADAAWFGAPTFENSRNLPDEYIPSLLATYHGRFLRQEVYGEFVGTVEGAVFFEWDPGKLLTDVRFNKALPLYSFWDFGMGDLGVVVFAQVEWVETVIDNPDANRVLGKPPPTVRVPKLYVLDSLEAADRTSAQWAREFKTFVVEHYGVAPSSVTNICDPAGRQRSISTGRSVIEDLYAVGLRVAPAPKRPVDYAIRILNNMMADERVMVAKHDDRMAGSLASHKWPTDSAGGRTGTLPVHDWTSHRCDALRYGVTTLLSFAPRRVPSVADEPYQPDQWGYIEQQLLKDDDPDPWGLAAQVEDEIMWEPTLLGSV